MVAGYFGSVIIFEIGRKEGREVLKVLPLLSCVLVLLMSCGGGDDEIVGDPYGVVNSDNLSCVGGNELSEKTDPASLSKVRACNDLRLLQESSEITAIEVVEEGEFATSVKVTAKILSCERACVREVEKTFEFFLNPAKVWELKGGGSFTETEASQIKRAEELGQDLAAGISLSVLTEETRVVSAYAIEVPVLFEAATLTEEQRRSWIELEAVLPDETKAIYWISLRPDNLVGKGEQKVTFYEKQQSDQTLLTGELEEGEMIKISCIRLAYQLSAVRDPIKTDCLPPIVK